MLIAPWNEIWIPKEREMKRKVSKDFIAAMEEKLEHGRRMGRKGWDSEWKETTFDGDPLIGLLQKLDEEVNEVIEAIRIGDLQGLRHECADVSNVAMMIADLTGALK